MVDRPSRLLQLAHPGDHVLDQVELQDVVKRLHHSSVDCFHPHPQRVPADVQAAVEMPGAGVEGHSAPAIAGPVARSSNMEPAVAAAAPRQSREQVLRVDVERPAGAGRPSSTLATVDDVVAGQDGHDARLGSGPERIRDDLQLGSRDCDPILRGPIGRALLAPAVTLPRPVVNDLPAIERPPQDFVKGLNRMVAFTVVALLMKAAKTFRSIQLLAERGLTDDAFVLVRTLYETSVAIMFILQKNSRVRARMYHVHSHRHDLKMLEHWSRTKGLKRAATKEAFRVIRRLLTDGEKGLPAGTDMKAIGRHWSGLPGGFEAAAKALGQERLYATLYRRTSSQAHASDFSSHVTATTEEIWFELAPSPDQVPMVSAIAREMLLMAVARVDRRFRLGYEIRLGVHQVKERPTK